MWNTKPFVKDTNVCVLRVLSLQKTYHNCLDFKQTSKLQIFPNLQSLKIIVLV